MRFLKNNLKLFIGMLIGAILAGGIVYAAISANQVDYSTNKNVEIRNVADALNDLYNKSEAVIDSQNVLFAESNGDNAVSKTATLSLNKGRYIVFICHSKGWIQNILRSDRNNTTDVSNVIEISSQNNNTEISTLKVKTRTQCPSNTVLDNYVYDALITKVYYVDVKNDSDIITHNYTGINQDNVPIINQMYGIKL